MRGVGCGGWAFDTRGAGAHARTCNRSAGDLLTNIINHPNRLLIYYLYNCEIVHIPNLVVMEWLVLHFNCVLKEIVYINGVWISLTHDSLIVVVKWSIYCIKHIRRELSRNILNQNSCWFYKLDLEYHDNPQKSNPL